MTTTPEAVESPPPPPPELPGSQAPSLKPPSGFLDVLNCGAGHLSFKFDRGKPEEVTKARKVLTDMLKRGYMLFIEVDGKQQRVRKFDPRTDEYILEEPDEPAETQIEEPAPTTAATPGTPGEAPIRRRGRPPGSGGRRVPLQHGRATAVGAIAGG